MTESHEEYFFSFVFMFCSCSIVFNLHYAGCFASQTLEERPFRKTRNKVFIDRFRNDKRRGKA
jgi:hypothetical protein